MNAELAAKRELVLCQDKDDLAHKAARTFASLVRKALSGSDFCSVALSGGTTPKLLFERLLQPDFADSIPWEKICFFVSDERCVPPDNAASNYGNAARQLLDPLKIADCRRHPTLDPEKDPEASAADYEEQIRRTVRPAGNGIPQFDIIFLGMGPDGHTASLFPDTKALEETQSLVSANYVDKLRADRITFTFKLINNACNVIFLVAGEDKAEVLAEVISGAGKYPSEKVDPQEGRLIWFVEKAAASRLPD